MNTLSSTPNRTSHTGAEAWPDDALVSMALADPTAFAIIFRKYAAPIHQYCDRCLGTREAAEDATQTVFLKAFASLRSCRDPEHFRAWLFSIAHNVIIDFRRSRRSESSIDAVEEVVDSSASPEELAISSSERLQITQLLGHLSGTQREVVELRLQGLTDKEIAELLGKTHQAVRAAQHRALVQMRALMHGKSRKGDGHGAA